MGGAPGQDVSSLTGSGHGTDERLASHCSDADVDIDQVELVQDFLQKPSQVRVALRIQIIKLPEYLVLGTRVFEVAEEAPNDDAYGGAVAAIRAVERLVKEVAGWLSGCVSGGQGTGCPR